MAHKLPPNKEVLKDLIDKIQEIKRIPQGRISKLAGFSTENYLSEAKSNNNVTGSIIKKVRSLYEKAINNPDILNEENFLVNEDEQPYGMTIKELLSLLRMEKESLKREQEALKIEQENLGRAQQTIQTLAEIIRPPGLNKNAKNV